jgi:hypothetical protein
VEHLPREAVDSTVNRARPRERPSARCQGQGCPGGSLQLTSDHQVPQIPEVGLNNLIFALLVSVLLWSDYLLIILLVLPFGTGMFIHGLCSVEVCNFFF